MMLINVSCVGVPFSRGVVLPLSCNQMIGGTAELLNASNRLKLPTYLQVYPILRPVRMFPAEVPQEVTGQARYVSISCLHLRDFN